MLLVSLSMEYWARLILKELRNFYNWKVDMITKLWVIKCKTLDTEAP